MGNDFKSFQIDVKSILLNGIIKEEVNNPLDLKILVTLTRCINSIKPYMAMCVQVDGHGNSVGIRKLTSEIPDLL